MLLMVMDVSLPLWTKSRDTSRCHRSWNTLDLVPISCLFVNDGHAVFVLGPSSCDRQGTGQGYNQFVSLPKCYAGIMNRILRQNVA